MAAHRYWRALRLGVSGRASDLELSEFQLLSGTTRVDASATLTASAAPSTGTLANLSDDSLGTSARWAAALVGALSLQWDFGGSPQEVTDIRLGSADAPDRFLLLVEIQYSDDGAAWSSAGFLRGILWPGKRAKTLSVTGSGVDVKGAGTRVILLANTTISLSPPAGTRVGDLLVVVLMRRSAAAALPSGWALRATGGPGALGGTQQWTDIYSKEATSGDLGSTVFGQVSALRLIGQMVVLAGVLSTPSFSSQNTAAMVDGTVLGPAVPLVTAGTDGIVIVGASGVTAPDPASWTPATLSSRLYTVFPPASATDNRLGVAARLLAAGESTAGDTITTNTLPPAGWALAAAVFAGAPLIARSVVFGRTEPLDLIRRSTEVSLTAYPVKLLSGLKRGRRDYVSGVTGQGIGRVKGTVKDKSTPSNIPARERVRLHRMSDGLLIRELWSEASTGAYSFDWIDEVETYYVVTFDHDGAFRAVIADGLTLANGGVELIA